MKRFKNILYVIDSDISLQDAIAGKVMMLARLNNASVTVATVLEDGQMHFLAVKPDGYESPVTIQPQ